MLYPLLTSAGVLVPASQTVGPWMSEKQARLGTGPQPPGSGSRRPQAGTLLCGLHRAAWPRGYWAGEHTKRKVISSVHPLFWWVQHFPKMWETESDPSQAEQVLQPWRSALNSTQLSREVHADQTHGRLRHLSYPSSYLCWWKGWPPTAMA